MIKEKIQIGLAYLMQALMVVFVFIAFYKKDYVYGFVAIGSLLITFFPLILKRKWKITLPWTLNMFIVLTLYWHIAGGVFGWYYGTFHMIYDKIGHFIGSATVALLGFASVLIIDKYTKVRLTRKAIIFFIIIFALAIGTMWEIGQFGCDKSGLCIVKAQTSLDDTMYDLIFDFAGGIIMAIIVNINLLRKSKEKLTNEMIKRKKFIFF